MHSLEISEKRILRNVSIFVNDLFHARVRQHILELDRIGAEFLPIPIVFDRSFHPKDINLISHTPSFHIQSQSAVSAEFLLKASSAIEFLYATSD